MIGKILSHYRVVDEIRRGGMGEVYRGWDLKLNREVAIKVLPRSLESSDPDSRKRFIQEAKATASLEHPYIATVFEVGEEEGVTFIAMELIRGRELTELIRNGSLDPDEAVEYAVEIAEALAFAHARGVIHRDLKPANVMVTDEGHIKIIDFGLAKLTQPLPVFDEASEDTAERAPSRSGFVKGTLSYMSPEQARGRPLDHRCDIFSFGVLLYEMIARKNPFQRESTLETAHAIIHEAAEPLSKKTAGDVAMRLQPILDRCLKKDASERFEDTRDLVKELKHARLQIESSTYERFRERPQRIRRLGIVAAAAAITILAALALWPRGQSVAVLRWDDDTVRETENVGQLAPLALNDRLRDFEGLAVTPFSVSRTFPPDADPLDVSRELGVDWIVQGRVIESSEGLTATVRLSGSGGGAAGWPQELRARSNEVLDLADLAAASVAETLGAGARDDHHTPASEIARHHYLEGRSHLWGWDVDQDFTRAEEAFQRSIAAEEDFAEAHAGLAMALWQRYRESSNPTLVERSIAEAELAVTLDPEIAETHLAHGIVLLGRGQAVDAEAAFEIARGLAPADDAVVRQIADTYAALGRLDDAEAMYQSAIDLRPGYWDNYLQKGQFYLYTRTDNIEKAKPLFREVIRLRPRSADGYNNLAAVHLMSGEFAEAAPLLQAAIEIDPAGDPAHNNLGLVYYTMGRFTDALKEFRTAIEISGFEDPMYLMGLADSYRQLDLDDEAGQYYERAMELWRQLLEVNPSASQERAILSNALAGLGRCDEAVAEAEIAAPEESELAYVHAIVATSYSICGDSDRALDHILRAIRGGAIFTIETNPDLKHYLDDPALASALREQP